MAYPDFSTSRPGQINQTGGSKANDEALFLKVFAGEVLTAFEQTNVTLDKHLVRTIASGKSAQFPVTGRIGAGYHVPGTLLTGQKVNHNEKTINIDGLLVSDSFIASIDEAMNHYDYRSIYSTESGRKLAKEWDINVFCELILAARATKALTDGADGTIVTDANLGSATPATKADALYKAIFAAAQAMDEKDVPETDRYCALKPAEYYCLVNAVQSGGFSSIHKDYGGTGSISQGKILELAGIQIVKSNNVPTTDLTARTYHGVNANTTKGVVWQKDAVGTVKLLDLATESDYLIQAQGTLMVAKYAIGHGILRCECAVELRTGVPT
jgi:hypothetical protein